MIKTGGIPPFSISLYEVAEYLQKNEKDSLIIALRGMLHHNISLLTNENIWPLNIEGLNKIQIIEKIKNHIKDKQKIIIIDAYNGNSYKITIDEVKEVCDENNKNLRLVKEFFNKV